MSDQSTPGKVTSPNDRPPTVTERVGRSIDRLLGPERDCRGERIYDSDIVEDTGLDLGLVRASLTLLADETLHVESSTTDRWVISRSTGEPA